MQSLVKQAWILNMTVLQTTLPVVLLVAVIRIPEITAQGGKWCPWATWGGWRTKSKWTQDDDIEPCPVGSFFAHRTRDCSDTCTGGSCDSGDKDETKECQNHWYCKDQYCEPGNGPLVGYECELCEQSTSQWNVKCPGVSNPMTKCSQCADIDAIDGKDAYCLRNGQCEHRCNWLRHDCWPGTCTKDQYLATTCKCIEGFVKSSDYTTKTTEYTQCDLVHKPNIVTCRIGSESQEGDAANNTFVGNTTSCTNSRDAFIKFDPKHMSFEFSFEFLLPEAVPKGNEQHYYIHDYSYGIIDGGFELRHHKFDGTIVSLEENEIKDFSVCTADFSKENPFSGLVTCNSSYESAHFGILNDGERICHRFKAVGSGFFRVKNLLNDDVSSKRFYDEMEKLHEICFMSDYIPPAHCVASTPACATDLLQFGNRIRTTLSFSAEADDWFDPYLGSKVVQPSGISKYEITVHNAQQANNELVIDLNTAVDQFESETGHFEITLPDYGQAHMFALYLDVLDSTQADSNARKSRRMILVDNSSQIETDDNQPMIITSAADVHGVNWQTKLSPITLDWNDHFYNTGHRTSNWLWPIRSDPKIDNEYDQISGELPISGTPNVHGIIQFQYLYHRLTNNITSSTYKDVPNFESEHLEIHELTIEDGDMVDIDIKVKDIMNNTYTERISVNIDSSPPLLENTGLFKDGYKYLFVHNQTDLSEMDMRFDTFDPHSGMTQILWTLGHSQKATDIGSGSMSVTKLNGSCPTDTICYCPIIGDCQVFHYGIDLNPIISNDTHEGTHHREYHFWIGVTNEARLESEVEFMVLIDDSPPEVGIVLDGPPGNKDRDFQNTPLLAWNWHGFIDHESGINKFHFAVGTRCFTKDELQFLDNLGNDTYNTDWYDKGETTVQFSAYEADLTGYYRISVIAFNNALEPSEVACSSGVTFDTSPPNIRHVDLIGVRIQENVACTNDSDIYYITPERRIQELSYTEHCDVNLCDETFDLDLYLVDRLNNGSKLPLLDESRSDAHCKNLPLLNAFENMFLPSDNLWLNWEASDAESQLLDFSVGLSSSTENVDYPNILGYQTTHNRTHYKCVHCGLSEGDIFYVMLKATNKAGLETIETFGPIIIDLTPPIYQGGIAVVLTDDDIAVNWVSDSFVDTEDTNPITDFYWALGTQSQPEDVSAWTKIVVNHNIDEIHENFGITFSVSELQEHDQDMGNDYIFSIKAVNRAGLYHVQQADAMKIHSKVLPSCGLVYHVETSSPELKEIGFQENNDTLCASWHSCVHNTEVIRYNVGLGNSPTRDDVVPYTQVNVTEGDMISWCFENLSLSWMNRYFVLLKACNGMGCSEVTSKGVVVITNDLVSQNGVAVDGPGCRDTFKHTLASDVVINRTKTFETDFEIGLTAISEYTIKILLNGYEVSDRHLIRITIDGEVIDLVFWEELSDELHLFYTFPVVSDSSRITVEADHYIEVKEIEIDQCDPDVMSQISAMSIMSRYSFAHSIHKYVSHYEISLYEQACSTSECSDPILVTSESAGKNLIHHFQYTPLSIGYRYNIEVAPCFGMTCAASVSSNGVLIDPEGLLVGYFIATMDTVAGNRTRYNLTAEWEPFTSKVTSLPDYTVHIYDWAISQTLSGGSLLTHWERVTTDHTSNNIKISTILDLPIHKKRTMFLAVRPHPLNHRTSIYYTDIELIDLTSSDAVQVFDLGVDYDLEAIKPYLHSSHLGALARELHDQDLDFTFDRSRINGAALGTKCDVTPWFIQTDPDINCADDPSNSACISHKQSQDNTVRFRNQKFEHGNKYYICGYVTDGTLLSGCPPTKACSNGFILDTQPPLAGSVIAGRDSSSLQSDNTLFYVHWNGFSDLEEELDIPYASGIAEYFVSLGTTRNGEDVVQFESAGHSTHKLFHELKLHSGTTYYATVKACDHVGLCSMKCSNGVLVDTTPPSTGTISLTFGHFKAYKDNNEDILVHYEDFRDHESGISHYELGVGTTPNGQDVKQFGPVASGIVSVSGEEYMVDGHSYYIQIKAVNRVGLWTIVSSSKFIYDASPPISGVVRWGESAKRESLRYTTNINHISGYWTGFSDAHTGIAYYRYGIGSAPGLVDMFSWQDVGLHDEFDIEFHLNPGFPYYLTVEACNGIYLCIKDSSSGPLIADNTVPLPGIVHVGMGQEHEHYQSNRHSISIKWFNFNDAESQVRRYYWCIGTTNSTCDVIDKQDAYLSHMGIKTGLHLPVGVVLYAIVEAVSHVDLISKAVSTAFVIDTSAPFVEDSPHNNAESELSDSAVYERSFISFSWKFADDMTPIDNHIISLNAHDDGIISLENVVVGDIRKYTHVFNEKDQLKDGSVYTFKVIACNAAFLCSSATSADFLLDSSPPHLGGFKEPMHWRNQGPRAILNLMWTGFKDPHSQVIKYNLMIGTTYNGDDLSERIIEVDHNNNEVDQKAEVEITKEILPGHLIYLTIWAINGAGLKSDVGKTSVMVLESSKGKANPQQGRLDIEKHSCTPHYCTGDCTCAAIGRTCTGDHLDDCTEIQSNTKSNHLKVHNGKNGVITRYSPSAVCLAAFWTWDGADAVKRFEWSVSAKDAAPGLPIFDIINEKYWFDVELESKTLYCLPKSKHPLEATYEYVFHVRAWHNFTSYTQAKSDGVLIETSSPRIQTGRIVKQMDQYFTEIIKFTTSTNQLHADWDRVFSDAQTGIDHFEIAFGNTQGGNEIFGPVDMGLQTNISLFNLTLTPGFKYYTTVHAFNPLGMVVSMTSDSFTVDTEPPIPGVVHTSRDFQDQFYHSDDVVFTWQGFYDKHSFIDEYFYLISQSKDADGQSESFIPHGIQNKLTIDASLLEENVEYYLHVKAMDAAGFESDIVTSAPVVVDITPPRIFPCDDHVAETVHSSNCDCDIPIEPRLHQTCNCDLHDVTLDRMTAYEITIDSNETNFEGRLQIGQFWDWLSPVRVSENKFRHISKFVYTGNGQEYITLHVFKGHIGHVSLTLGVCSPTSRFAQDTIIDVKQVGPTELQFHWLVGDETSGIKSLQLGLGTTKTGYQLMELTDVGTVNSLTLSRQVQHNMQIYATLIAENHAGLREHFHIKPLTIDWTGPTINSIQATLSKDSGGLFVLAAVWNATDTESSLTDCLWSVGSGMGKSDFLQETLTDTLHTSTAPIPAAMEGDDIYIHLRCHNNIGLYTTATHYTGKAISRGPQSQDASVTFIPEKQTVYEPRLGIYQSTNAKQLQFTFHGFEDVANITGYSYMVEGRGMSPAWNDIGVVDTIILQDDNINDETLYIFKVRAKNSYGYESGKIDSVAYLSKALPQLSGKTITSNIVDNKLILDWSQVFIWESSKGALLFEIQVGPVEDSALFLNTETLDTRIEVNTHKFESPGVVFCVLTAVTPSGEFIKYKRDIDY